MQRRAGEDQAEHGAGAGRPQQPGGDADQGGRQHAAARAGLLRAADDPVGGLRQRLADAGGQGREQQRDAEQREAAEREPAPVAAELRDAAQAGRAEARDQREAGRQADQQRQAGANEGAVGPGEHEGHHGQDAGAQHREHAGKEGDEYQQHDRIRVEVGGRAAGAGAGRARQGGHGKDFSAPVYPGLVRRAGFAQASVTGGVRYTLGYKTGARLGGGSAREIRAPARTRAGPGRRLAGSSAGLGARLPACQRTCPSRAPAWRRQAAFAIGNSMPASITEDRIIHG